MLLLFYLSGFFINHPDHLFNCHSEHFFTVILNETRLIRRASEESYGVLKAEGSFASAQDDSKKQDKKIVILSETPPNQRAGKNPIHSNDC